MKFWSFFSVYLFFLNKFIVSYIISFRYYRQTNFSGHTNSFYSVLFTYIFRNIVRKNMRIMFEKLYETHLCAVQFLEHDLHIFALFLNVIKVFNNSSMSSFFIVLAKGSTSPIINRQEHIN